MDFDLPIKGPTGLGGLDLPSLDDLMWEDAICNDFGVPTADSTSTHQSTQGHHPGCTDCAQSLEAEGTLTPSIPWNDSFTQKLPFIVSPAEGQVAESVPAPSSPEEQLHTPPQTDRVLQPRPEPTSSRDSAPGHLSPQSSCDLPDGSLKRRQEAQGSPERRQASSEGKSADTDVSAGTKVRQDHWDHVQCRLPIPQGGASLSSSNLKCSCSWWGGGGGGVTVACIA